MRVSVMSPRLSVERNAFAPIGKPMALRHFAAEDEHGHIDSGAGDGDFFCVEAIDGLGDARAQSRARPRRARAECGSSWPWVPPLAKSPVRPIW
jgi:hypothetical protein